MFTGAIRNGKAFAAMSGKSGTAFGIVYYNW